MLKSRKEVIAVRLSEDAYLIRRFMAMKTRKKVLALFLALTLIMSAVPSAFAAANSYADVPSDHWANGVIAKWSGDAYGVLQGNGDGTFAPSRGLTLGELATILSKTFGYTERISAEVTPAWADEAVEQAMAARIIDKTDEMTRALPSPVSKP
jgi:hypothetical protein